jgi:5'-deoxynucleotidase YfbR-like HD superfamily hydrolase
MYPSILLRSGNYFDFTNPERSTFTVADVAHALARICRFTGHCHHFYSVAQHSVLVSKILPPELQMAGLLHDAHEAFVGDIAAPLKLVLPDFRELEDRVQRAVLERFSITLPLHSEIKRADLVLLATEKRDLMHVNAREWQMPAGVTPLEARITPKTPAQAEREFISRFQELTLMGDH